MGSLNPFDATWKEAMQFTLDETAEIQALPTERDRYAKAQAIRRAKLAPVVAARRKQMERA